MRDIRSVTLLFHSAATLTLLSPAIEPTPLPGRQKGEMGAAFRFFVDAPKSLQHIHRTLETLAHAIECH
jgi:hypothetical protein